MGRKQNILVVGAGFSGVTVARVLAEEGYKITVIDQRSHVGGNAFDYVNESGIRVHKYGPHIFHSDNEEVFVWLSRFTEWNFYEHRVNALLEDGSYVPFPVNQETLKLIDEKNIHDIFFKPYSNKMWGDYFELVKDQVLKRVEPRKDFEDRYFGKQKFQFMPKDGYSKLFENILDHPNIKIFLEKKFDRQLENDFDHCFNSMAIDEYYDYCYGELPYRSIKFHNYKLPFDKILPSAVINFTTAKNKYTRVTEWKHFPNHGNNPIETLLTVEEPCDYKNNNNEKYYPVPAVENRNLYKKYKDIVNNKTTFIGRCGMYVYIDMDMAVSSSLAAAKRFLGVDNDIS